MILFGIGPLGGQVPAGASRSTADAYGDVIDVARLAEDAGFDSLWVSEHHGAPNSHLPSPLVLLAAASSVTRTLILGTGVALAPFQNPLRFAEDCAVLDQLSKGRLVVGMGAGWRQEEFDMFGVAKGERGSRTTEMVEVCRAAWGAGRFSHRGSHFSYDDALVTPKPFARIPIMVGGSAPAALSRAGRLGDGFMGTGTPQCGLAEFQRQVRAFDQAATDAGRDPRELVIGFHVNAWVSGDGRVPPAVRGAMWSQVGTYAAWHAADALGGPGPIDEAEIFRRSFIGTPDEVIEQARPWVEAFPGRRMHVLFRLHYPGMTGTDAEPAIRLFGSAVIPALRRLGSVDRPR